MADLSVRGNPNTYYARMKVWVAIESNNSVSVDSVDGTADTGAALVISGFSQKTATNTAAYIQVPILTVANPATYIIKNGGIYYAEVFPSDAGKIARGENYERYDGRKRDGSYPSVRS
ncbi:MAG: hypothetical protein IJS94_07315 [Clostridia bacterium]|nr:hypothetical protein [Clostridia bacterium]